ncbi:cation:proton antiporter [Cytobacillus sp. NCCP-133]|uniref:cation:proton antiporter n=1 Tax=Cytobacillus sp. NCCP-133 TaxID=766848 RepID=UPI00222EE907|nr:cation:proton antiporter [Cytobacillus sp. NCCP-133]GLB58700.1 sodium:proton antiporter [Cytobacillus sp. NCCP-133]
MNMPLAIGLIFLVLFITALIGIKILRIPDIVIYIILGAGIGFLGYYQDTKVIEVAGEIGLILLFFLLGMKFSVRELRKNGNKVWKPGLLDVLLGIGVTTGIVYIAGQSLFVSLLIGGLVYATSSSITVKLLESKNRLDDKDSEYMLSLLIFEDLIAPILVTVLIGLKGENFSLAEFLFIFLKVAILAGIAILMSRIVLHKAQHWMKKVANEDSFLILVLGVAITYGGFAVFLGLSEVIGAFLAGIMLAGTVVKEKVEEVVLPVRNLFLPFFFLHFGLSLEFKEEIPSLGLLAIIFLWSIIHKLTVGYFGGQWYGLSKTDSLKSGFSLASRGEFSVIIAGLATGGLKVFAGAYILIAALAGMLLFQLAPLLQSKFAKERK